MRLLRRALFSAAVVGLTGGFCWANCYLLKNDTRFTKVWKFDYNMPVGPNAILQIRMIPHGRYPVHGRWCWGAPGPRAAVYVDNGQYRTSWKGSFVMGDDGWSSPSGTYSLEPVGAASDAPTFRSPLARRPPRLRSARSQGRPSLPDPGRCYRLRNRSDAGSVQIAVVMKAPRSAPVRRVITLRRNAAFPGSGDLCVSGPGLTELVSVDEPGLGIYGPAGRGTGTLVLGSGVGSSPPGVYWISRLEAPSWEAGLFSAVVRCSWAEDFEQNNNVYPKHEAGHSYGLYVRTARGGLGIVLEFGETLTPPAPKPPRYNVAWRQLAAVRLRCGGTEIKPSDYLTGAYGDGGASPFEADYQGYSIIRVSPAQGAKIGVRALPLAAIASGPQLAGMAPGARVGLLSLDWRLRHLPIEVDAATVVNVPAMGPGLSGSILIQSRPYPFHPRRVPRALGSVYGGPWCPSIRSVVYADSPGAGASLSGAALGGGAVAIGFADTNTTPCLGAVPIFTFNRGVIRWFLDSGLHGPSGAH